MYFIETINLSSKRNKLFFLLFICLTFTIIYYFIPDSEFGGINKFQELVRDELIKKKVEKKLKIDNENFINYFNENKVVDLNIIQDEADSLQELDYETEKELDKKTLETTKLIAQKEFKKENYTTKQKFIDRLYFSIVTGTTLGYGDVYPLSNRTKMLAVIQLLLTLTLIIL